jgi:hypothetical protein
MWQDLVLQLLAENSEQERLIAELREKLARLKGLTDRRRSNRARWTRERRRNRQTSALVGVGGASGTSLGIEGSGDRAG